MSTVKYLLRSCPRPGQLANRKKEQVNLTTVTCRQLGIINLPGYLLLSSHLTRTGNHPQAYVVLENRTSYVPLLPLSYKHLCNVTTWMLVWHVKRLRRTNDIRARGYNFYVNCSSFFFLRGLRLTCYFYWCLGMSCLWRPLITYLKASTKSISS